MSKELPEIGSEFTLSVLGKTCTFKHFMPKRTNLIKINLPGESIWACISDEDMIDYHKDIEDPPGTVRVATLRNMSINGFPWGCYIPYHLVGSGIPENRLDILDEDSDIVLNLYEVQEPTEEEEAKADRLAEEAEARRMEKPEITQQHIAAITSMSYRKIGDNPEKWGKPIGGQLLTIELDRREMTIWFEAYNDGTICRWNTQGVFAHRGDADYRDLDELDSLAAEIKHAEANLIQCWRGRVAETKFHFLSKSESIHIALDL